MPETSSLETADIAFVYTNIGRGHPFYLDGIIEVVDSEFPEIKYFVTDIFSSGGWMTRVAWSLIRQMYHVGSRGGLFTRFYNRIRKRTEGENSGRLLVAILGRDIAKKLRRFSGLVVVAHPLLARILENQNRVVYQHGELVFPQEAAVFGCEAILVPSYDVAEQAERLGIGKAQVVVTGQCLERDLVPNDDSSFSERIERYQSGLPISVALFTSGAYPVQHLELLFKVVCSLSQCEVCQYIFMGQSVREHRRFGTALRQAGLQFSGKLSGSEKIRLISSSSRAEENQQVATIFKRLDCAVAPSHERTNWAVGLGLPMFFLTPHIGSYAPLNAKLALGKGVAREIKCEDAENLGGIITEMRRNGALAAMSQSGYHPSDTSGFNVATDYLIKFAQTSGKLHG